MAILKATLTSTELVTSHLGIFTFRPNERIPFLPGQYVTLGVSREGLRGEAKNPKHVRNIDSKETVLRALSIASPPEEEDIELFIVWVQRDGKRKDEKGLLSTELFQPRRDLEYLFLSNKAKGRFLLPEDSRDVIMVATGTGLAPYLSMLKSDEINHGNRRYVLIHGVSCHSDLAYREELTDLTRVRNLTYLHTCSREECDDCQTTYAEELFLNREEGKKRRVTIEEVEKAVRQGRINDTGIENIIGRETRPERTIIMLCGNPAMIDNIKLIAEAKNFQVGEDIVTEEYW